MEEKRLGRGGELTRLLRAAQQQQQLCNNWALGIAGGSCSYVKMKAARINMLGSAVSNAKVKYSRLAADEDGYIDLQFKKSPPKVPYKAIALAVFLFLIGSLLIIFGALLLSGTIKVEGLK
ncbi:unnamed protein product [Pleuronectes platessa]|uniref:Uncharacterized protein n=1 Tax=Pleuronectes platessa TaxID=8262 RepID=A0A9N7UND8_PLEPL|nr:unnamed protein product [Pleuronectes platessa]